MSCKYCVELQEKQTAIRVYELEIGYQNYVKYDCPVKYCPNCGEELNTAVADTRCYGFRTIKQIADKLKERNKIPNAEPVSFTLDTPEDLYDGFEPTNWYGITLSNLFDATSVLIGNNGIGVLWSDDVESNGMSIEESLIAFIYDEEHIKADENYKICIDPEEWR